MSLASVPRESSGQNERPLMAAQAAPAPAGDSHWCHGFCQRENKKNNIISLHRITSAKTRATATLRQRHIPPNVRGNCINNFLIFNVTIRKFACKHLKIKI